MSILDKQQSKNALSPMEVTELPMTTLFRFSQSQNVSLPMALTELPIMALVRALQSRYLQLVVGQWIPVKMVEK